MSEQPPQGAVQASADVAKQVINGLQGQPALLALIVFNCIVIGVAAWFLAKIADVGKENMHAVINACFSSKPNR